MPDDPCVRTRRRLAEGENLEPDDPHATNCPDCRAFAARAAALNRALAAFPEDPLPADLWRRIQKATVAVPAFPARRPAIAAVAAAALLVAAGLMFPSPRAPAARPRTLPPGEPLAAAAATDLSAGAAERLVSLPGGTRLRIAPSTRATLLPPEEDGSPRVALAHGTIDCDVTKDAGGLLVESAAGRARVAGTVFRARALRVRGGAGAFPVLCVEVSEGRVDMSRGATSFPVRAGQRGLLWGQGGRRLQESTPRSWRAALADFGGAWREPGFPASAACVTLLAASWEDLSTWAAALDDRSVQAPARAAAAFLAGLAAEPEEAEALRARAVREADPTVRRVLEDACRWLEDETGDRR